jgi:UDP-glucose 4-epimerase
MRVVIIGGAGYIGYHIGLDLYHRGHTVTLFDLSYPNEEWLTEWLELAGESENPLPFVKGSILSISQLNEVLKSTKAEGVVHCGTYITHTY